MKIYFITDSQNFYGQKLYPWESLDIDKIISKLRSEYEVEHITFYDVANSELNIENSIVLYTSSQQPEYKEYIEGDMRFLESSSYVDQLLSAQESEIFLYRPDVERQFIKIGSANERFIKIHLFDIRGDELVSVEGNKRIRTYMSINHSENKSFYYQQMITIFNELRLSGVD